MTAGETKFKIVYHIYRYGPKSLAELAKSLHMPRQKIHYNITQLMKEGVILKDGDKYMLQPLYTDESADIYLKFINLMTDITDYLVLDENCDMQKAVLKNFEYYILLVLGELDAVIRPKRKVS